MDELRFHPPPASTPLDGLVDLASSRLGGRAVAANDEFFAPKENLVSPHDPVFDPERYTERGKWMDGWETRRRRTPGHDWCEIELGAPGVIRRVVVDTRYFRGNHPEACSIDARAEAADDAGADAASGAWREVLHRVPLVGDAPNSFEIDAADRVARVRLNIFPDGGVARLRVLGEPRPDWSSIVAGEATVDLAAAQLGGAPLACSDRFFSDPRNLLLPEPSSHMGDGWETKRRRGPGNDWTVIRLARPGKIEVVEVDTAHFKGNYPAACSLEGLDARADAPDGPGPGAEFETMPWRELLSRSELGPDAGHRFEIHDPKPVTHVRFNIFPDGGVARLRLRGRPSLAER